MNRKAAIRLITVSLVLVSLILACNLPGRDEVQPTISEPTPNMTMTSLFSIVTKAPGLSTPVVAVTATPGAELTATQIAPTNTSIAISTATSGLPLVTNTPQATAELRSAGKAVAAYFSTAPKLDGIWDEWTSTAYPARYAVYGKSEISNKEDLEGSFRIGWDESNLYIAVKVYDDKYVQNATGIDIFKGDSIELLFDVDLMGDLTSKQQNSDDYQLVFSPGKGGVTGEKETHLYYPANVAGPRTQVKIASVYGGGILRAEIAVPWSVLGVTPTSGKQFGFAVSMNDNDNEGQIVLQSMVSNVQNRSLTDPTTWALLELKK